MKRGGNRKTSLQRLGVGLAVLLAFGLLLVVVSANIPPLGERAEISFVVPADRHGFFVVPRSKSLPPGGRYVVVVPLNGICRPIPADCIIFLDSHDTRGRFVPIDWNEDTDHPTGDAVTQISSPLAEDPRGDLYFLGNYDQLRRSFPSSGKFTLGFR